MLGIAVQLALSWLILWLVEKKNLSVLGLYPTSSRMKALLILFVAASVCSLFETGLRMQFFKERYQLNPLFNYKMLLEGFRWNLISVLYEELIFRGALLYILMKRWGPKPGMLLSAITFGIYHWFSYNLFGNVPGMIYTFIITGCMGWVLAFAYVKTKSMYMAIAFHLGWNFTSGFIFSRGSAGSGVYVPVVQQPFVTVSYFISFVVAVLPFIVAVLCCSLLVLKINDRDS